MRAPSLLSNTSVPNTGEWQDRHDSAIVTPKSGVESALVDMFYGWEEYARAHKKRFEMCVGEDSYLGSTWEAIGDSLRTLLNGELGRLDGGTLDSFILDTMRANGIDVENK